MMFKNDKELHKD